MSTYTDVFEQLGLSKNEAKIYEMLLHNGRSSTANISVKAGVHRRNVYDAIERLLNKGLVFRVLGGSEYIYEAVTPDKLKEIVEEKSLMLQDVLPSLRDVYYADVSESAAFIYKGLEGYKNYLRDLTRISEDAYFIGAKGNWVTSSMTRSLQKEYHASLTRQDKQVHILFDPRVRQREDIISSAPGAFRFLPEGYATPGVLDIVGDYIFMFSSLDIGNFGEHGEIFVVVNRQLADTYRTWFHMIWEMCAAQDNS